MLPHHLPELDGKVSKDTGTMTATLKYVAIVSIAICTIVVSALFVKVYILQAEPSLHNKVDHIEEDKKAVHKDQDEVYVVGVNIDLEHPTTIAPTLEAIICEPVNQESSEDKSNKLKQKHLDSHIFQSIIPANIATNDEEMVKPIEQTYIKIEDSNLNPFVELLPLFNYTNGKEQKVNNERKAYDNEIFENIFKLLFPTFDSEETDYSALIDEPFKFNETFLNIPFNKTNFYSQEKLFQPIDSSKVGIIDFPKSFTDSLEEQPQSTTISSNESSKHITFPIV